MKVCDRHQDRPAVDSLHIELDDAFFDVCESCKQEVLTLLTSKDQPKTLFQKVFGKPE